MSQQAQAPFKIKRDGQTKTFDDRGEWEDMVDLLERNGVDFEAIGPGDATQNNGTEPADTQQATDTEQQADGGTPEPDTEPEAAQAVVEAPADTETPVNDQPDVVEPSELSTDPIGFLQSVNSEFVNTIKGKPAISKQGFRFIQREFEISTESEVVEWSDDPLGVVVWAKAELPNGYSAEAHGEGYQFEQDVDDNEFVRYADTRAKNRAISDLTSAGALAVSELEGQQ